MDPTQPKAEQPYQPAPSAYPPPGYQPAPQPGYGPGQAQYSPYPQVQPPQYPPYAQDQQAYYQGYAQGWNQRPDPGNGLSIAAIVLGVISILFLPIIFGPIGLILAGIAKSKHQRLSTAALWASGGGMILGFIVGALVFAAMH